MSFTPIQRTLKTPPWPMAHMSYSAYYIIARIRLLTSLATSLGLRLLQLTGVSGLTSPAEDYA